MDYIQLSENALRQVIDSTTVYDEFLRVQKQARTYAGGMYWKQQGSYEYLVKTTPDNQQTRMGSRSSETEAIYESFTKKKSEIETRLASIKAALIESERLNKAVKAGRVPTIVVSILDTLEQCGLANHFTVVGTHALYAYETAAAVRIRPGALATQDVDLLWDARRRVQFFTDMERLDTSMLEILQKVDHSFTRKEGQLETAINEKGFEIDFLRRQPVGDDPHPIRFTDDEDDLWPVQAKRASILTNSPTFEHLVIGSTGKMALMRTIDPATFVEFKLWLAEKSEGRPEIKRRRDLLQAKIVQSLLDENLLDSKIKVNSKPDDDDESNDHGPSLS